MGDAAARMTGLGTTRARSVLRALLPAAAGARRRSPASTTTTTGCPTGRRKAWSAAADEMRDAARAMLDAAGRVPTIDAGPRVSRTQVDLALADAFLEIQIAEHESRHFYRGNPALVDRRGDLRASSR